VVNERVELYL